MNRFQLTASLVAGVAAIGAAAIAQAPDRQSNRGDHIRSMLDTDEDGTITSEEITAHRTAIFAEIDIDGDGTLTSEELIARHQVRRAARRAERKAARQARHFGRLDTDGNGGVSLEEFASGRSQMLGRLDKDGDGNLSAEELENMQRGPRGNGPRDGGQ